MGSFRSMSDRFPGVEAAGIVGVIWILGAFAIWIIQENAGALVVVSPYAIPGLAYLLAIIADRDRRWRKTLSRVQLIGLLLTVVLFVSTLVALRADP